MPARQVYLSIAPESSMSWTTTASTISVSNWPITQATVLLGRVGYDFNTLAHGKAIIGTAKTPATTTVTVTRYNSSGVLQYLNSITGFGIISYEDLELEVSIKTTVDSIKTDTQSIINGYLNSGSYGLPTLQSMINGLNTILASGTHGNAALKALLDTLNTKMTNMDSVVDNIYAIVSSGSVGNSVLQSMIQQIVNDIGNATNGLTAIKNATVTVDNVVDSIYAIVNHGTNGNAAIRTAIGTIISSIGDGTNGLTAIKTAVNAISTSLATADSVIDDVYAIVNNVNYGNSAIKDMLNALGSNTYIGQIIAKLDALRFLLSNKLSGTS